MTALLLYVACRHGTRPTGTPDGSVVCLCSGRHFFHFAERQVQDLTGVLETFSLTQRQISEHETRADRYSQHWKSWQDGWWHDQRWTQTPVVGSWWDDAKLSWNSWQDLDRWAAPSGYPSRKWDISEPSTFPGFSANYLMWRKAVLRWKMTTDHPVEKLGTKVMNSLDWTVQAFVDARISTEALLQPDAVESILRVLDAKAAGSRRTSPNSSCERHCSAWKEARTSLCDNTRQEGWRRLRQSPQPLWSPCQQPPGALC